MASLTQPSEHGASIAKVNNPSGGTITWDSTVGEYKLYLSAQKNEQGEVVVPAQNVSLKGMEAAILAVDYVTFRGFKSNGTEGLRISAPLYYVGTVDRRGKRWQQEFAVWIGDDKAPAESGNWNQVKAHADANGGKFTRVWYVLLLSSKMEKPFILEFKGKELESLGDAMKDAGVKFENELTSGGIYAISLAGKTAYTIARNEFYQPKYAIKQIGKHPDYSKIYDAAIKLCQGIDRYTAYLLDKQYQYDKEVEAATPDHSLPTQEPAFYPAAERTMDPVEVDDLPF